MTETQTPWPVVADRYQITGHLAKGGMADVYQARDVVLNRPVAVKILFPHYAATPSFVERFRREAQAAGGLSHPNIAAVFDCVFLRNKTIAWECYTGVIQQYLLGSATARDQRQAERSNRHKAIRFTGRIGANHGGWRNHQDRKVVA